MDLIGKRFWFFLLSSLIILPGILSMLIPGGLRAGIEFRGGSVLTLTFDRTVTETVVRNQLIALNHEEALIQKLDERTVFIRTSMLAEAELDKDGNVINQSERDLIEKALEKHVGSIETREFDTVSPLIAGETLRNAGIAVLVAAIGILLYITWAFRRVPSPFRYGLSAIIALVHDLAVVLSVYSILSRFLNLEINTMVITGFLTVLGYSVHDTIVVFDRIRENVTGKTYGQLDSTINISLWETISRSLNTSFTTLLAILALLLFGGHTLQGFLIILLVGVISGTYSSFFVAAQFLIVLERGELGKILRRIRLLPKR